MAAAALCSEARPPAFLKIFLGGEYRAGIRYSEWYTPSNESEAIEVGSMEENLVRYDDVKDWEHEKFRKADQPPEAGRIVNELTVAVTPEHPYTATLSDETEEVWLTVWVTALHDKDMKWKEFFTDHYRKDGTRCYSLEGTADNPTWRLLTEEEMPSCSR